MGLDNLIAEGIFSGISASQLPVANINNIISQLTKTVNFYSRSHKCRNFSPVLKGVYYTKPDFEEKYPQGSKERKLLELEIDQAYAKILQKVCDNEYQGN